MKIFKYTLAVLVFVFCLSFVKTTLAGGLVLGLSQTNIDLSETLRKGSTGEEVTKLQDFLIFTEYLKIQSPTGYFGSQTEEAVKKLQDSVGLNPDGIVGEQTRTFFKTETVSEDRSLKDENTIRDCEEGDKFSQLTGKPCVHDRQDESRKMSDVPGCDKSEYIFSPLSGKRCDGKDNTIDKEEDVRDDSADDEEDENKASDDSNNSEERTLGRIMFWYGKVNQHTDSYGNWQTDPDGVSGAGSYAEFGAEGYGDRKLEYCQKFYPTAKSFLAYKLETISTWKERGNVNNWPSTKLSYLCMK